MGDSVNTPATFSDDRFDNSRNGQQTASRMQSPSLRYDTASTSQQDLGPATVSQQRDPLGSDTRTPLMSLSSGWNTAASSASSASDPSGFSAFAAPTFSRNAFPSQTAYSAFAPANPPVSSFGSLQSNFFNSASSNDGGTQPMQGFHTPSLTPKSNTPVLEPMVLDMSQAQITQWVYIDFYGQQQGPFSGVQMSEWHSFLTNEILLKRVTDDSFVPLMFIKAACGMANPFLTPITNTMWDSAVKLSKAQQPPQPPPPLQQPMQPQMDAYNMNMNMNNNMNVNGTGLSYGYNSAPRSSSIVDAIGKVNLGVNQDSTPTPTVSATPNATPNVNVNVNAVVDVSANATVSATTPTPTVDSTPASTAATTSTTSATTSATTSTATVTSPPLNEKSKEKKKPSNVAPIGTAPTPPSAPTSTPTPSKPISPIGTTPQSVISAIGLGSKSTVNSPRLSRTTPSINQNSSVPVSPTQKHMQSPLPPPVQQAPPPKPVPVAHPAPIPTVDPWKKPTTVSRKLSIAELKQEQLEKEKKKGAAKKSENSSQQGIAGSKGHPSTASAQASAQAAQTAPVKGSSQPISSNSPQGWAKPAVRATKTLSEIQREQQAQQAQQAQQSANKSRGTKQPVVERPVQTQPKLSGRFSVLDDTASESVPPTELPSKPQHRKPHPSGYSVTAQASRARPSDELIHWAKFSFKDLAKDVDQIELLKLFLSLPANKNAKEFIAESIYSYSRSLDGRRFAQDFLDRKKAAEGTMKDGETWDDVLKRFNPNAEPQDPSFKVVTKKRSRAITRPDGVYSS